MGKLNTYDSVRDVLDTNGISVPRVEVAITDDDYD